MNWLNKYNTRSCRAAICIVLAFIMGACAADDPESPEVPANDLAAPTDNISTKVDILIYFGSDWNTEDSGEEGQTRGLPPGVNNNHDDNRPVDGSEEMKEIDKVRVVTFRRPDPDYISVADNENDITSNPEAAVATHSATSSFLYDRSNDLVLTADYAENLPDADRFPAGDGHDRHKVATGTITKTNGFEYRIIAIAYSSTSKSEFSDASLKIDGMPMPDGDNDRFMLNLHDGLTLDEFEAEIQSPGIDRANWDDLFYAPTENPSGILGNRVIETPQFFYGECYVNTASGPSGIIKYSDMDASGNLTKDMEVTGILYRGVAKIEVNIHKVDAYRPTLTSYPCKGITLMTDNAPLRVGLKNYDCFLPKNIEKGVIPDGKFIPISYRPAEDKVTLTAYILPCRARLAIRIRHASGGIGYLHNGWLNATDTETAENGTGIISPDSHDGYFYFRRNHKYVINVNSSDALIKKYPL